MGSSRLARALTMARPRMFGSTFVLQSSVAPLSARVTSQRLYSILPAANCKIWDEFGNGIANNRQQMCQSQGYTFLQAMYLSSKPASEHVEPAAASATEEAVPAKAEVKAEQFRGSDVVMSAKHPSEEEIEKLREKGLTYSRYWGIAPAKITREDGSPWPWNCFMPRDTYRSDLSIDLKKHHAPSTVLDKIAYWTVKVLRVPTDIFFQRRYGCRAMMLETVAAVPGMVGGMLLHCKSLRRFQHSGGWIKALLEEAENERMHLMTFMEVVKPKWYEKALVFAVQGVFFNAYFLMYVLSPKLAHRVVGYLEEEAIHSYTEFLKDIDKGAIPNIPAPAIAIDYWRLPKDATLRDVVIVVRADEAHHRDVNHFASDIHYQGKELNEARAPLGYH